MKHACTLFLSLFLIITFAGCAMMTPQYPLTTFEDSIRTNQEIHDLRVRVEHLTLIVREMGHQVIRLSVRSDEHTRILFVVAPLSVGATVMSIGAWAQARGIVSGLEAAQAGH